MKKIRLGMIALTASGLALFGCDDDGSDTDAGPPVVIMDGSTDAGGGGGDDAGFDAGGGGGSTCGPMGGECTIDPSNAATACTNDPASGMPRTCYIQGGGGDPWTTTCFPVGTTPEGGSCTPTVAGECDVGLQCFGDAGSATCRRLCCSNSDCGGGAFCTRVAEAGPMGMEAGLCETPSDCDPLVMMNDGSNRCAAGEGCYPNMGTLVCRTAGTVAEGESCASLTDCEVGHACVSAPSEMGMFFCRQMCDPTATPTTCPTGRQCNGLNGFTNLGSCAVMM